MPPVPPETLASLVQTRRVLVTVGAGGVGKTTTAAALGLAAARRGRRVLVLTIDPARRLAESLGIETMSTEAVDIDPKRFKDYPLEGSLTAMMLDTKRTFDDLILKHSSSKEKARKLLDNRLYQYISTSLAGTQEYMAMEKLVAVKNDPRWDLIVLDTPPTANALDFLDAPERLMEMLDSATMKWFVEAFETSGKLSLNLLARSAAMVLRGIGKITGGGFLEAMAEFITELNDLFGGFKHRAAQVQKTLRMPEVAFVLVTSPSPMSIREARYFSERLASHDMPRGAFVVNRFHAPPPLAGTTDRRGGHRGRARARGTHARGRRRRAPAEGARGRGGARRARRAQRARARRPGSSSGGRSLPIVRVRELASDVHDLKLLSQIAETLMSGGI